MLASALPAVPILLYDILVMSTNPALQIWNAQNTTPSPTPDKYLFGFGLLLLVAIPGIWRGIRRFERDGDRLMIVWLVVNVLLLYAPVNFQRRMSMGLIIPIVYFGVRALEDYWFQRISPRWRDAVLLTFFVFILPSNALSIFIPLAGVGNASLGLTGSLLLPKSYVQAINWLRTNGEPGAVVLASYSPSLWIPAYSDLRVVYGHPLETLHSKQRFAEVLDWYAGKSDCLALPAAENVRYVLARRVPADDVEAGYPEACIQALVQDAGATPREFGDVLLLELP